MRLYARVAKFYGFSHTEMRNMHFLTFMGYVREMNLMVEEQNNANNPQANTPNQQIPPNLYD